MTPEDAIAFVSENHRAVLVTRHPRGRLQTSPITVGTDGTRIEISSRESAYKTRNLRRDPAATLCVMNDAFFGAWMQIDGTAEIVSLPDAMEGLVDYYRRIRGEHPDWGEYRSAMEEQQRVLILVSIERVGPTRTG